MSPVDLHVERDGRPGAPALVLLHGFTGSARTWDRLRAALRDEFDLLAVDLPGHGASPAPDDPRAYALENVAEDLARLLDRQRVQRCAVLGYSLGGRHALRFALDHPARVTRLILESTSPGIDDPAEREARRLRDHELADRIEREGVERFVDQWERLPLWHSQASLSPAALATQRAIRLAHTARGLANSLRGAGQGEGASVVARLPALERRVLLIVGALDRAYVAHARRMCAALAAPLSRVLEFESTGHAVHLEQPDAYAAAVRDFLAR